MHLLQILIYLLFNKDLEQRGLIRALVLPSFSCAEAGVHNGEEGEDDAPIPPCTSLMRASTALRASAPPERGEASMSTASQKYWLHNNASSLESLAEIDNEVGQRALC